MTLRRDLAALYLQRDESGQGPSFGDVGARADAMLIVALSDVADGLLDEPQIHDVRCRREAAP